MGRILIDVKDKTRDKILTMAFRQKVTIKKLILTALKVEDEK